MKRFALIYLLLLAVSAVLADDKASPAPFSTDFAKETKGELPDGIMEIDGIFVVTEDDAGGKYLQMAAEPLTENAVIFGPSVKGGATVEAKVRSFKKRRSYPRFGVGLHGLSGFRLRVVPSRKEIELVKNEEPVKAVAFDWKADSWTHLKLSVRADGDIWKVEGRAWSEGEDEPKEPTISFDHEGSPGQGKASLWGTAYSGKVVQFDDLKVVPAPAK